MTIKKFVTNLFWSEGHEDVYMSSEANAAFNINLGKLFVGTLEYSEGTWKFSYSDPFKMQKDISPLVNFPSKDKVYIAKDLWPFFASRIPSNAQLQISKESTAKESIVDLLKKHGRKTIANPFELFPA